LYLNIKGIRIGPTPPAFITPNIFKILQEKFDLRFITKPEKDLQEILG
jgi:hydroxylamine reductase